MRKCLKPVSGGAVLGSEDNLAALHNSKGLFEGKFGFKEANMHVKYM